jgi:hypothetical protein
MGHISNPGDMFIRGANASGFMFGSFNNTPPFSPTIVVPSNNPVINILNPGYAGQALQRKYNTYYADAVSYFLDATPIETTHGRPEIDASVEDNYSMMWTGYIYSPSFGDYVLETTSDDSSMLWVGDKAISGWNSSNADVNNGGLHGATPRDTLPNVIRMEAGWYPVRIVFGEMSGAEKMAVRMYKYGANSDEYVSFAYNSATPEGFNP